MSVKQTYVTTSERSHCTLRRIDYEDAFLLALGADQSREPEFWARAVLEGAPAPLRKRLRLADLATFVRHANPLLKVAWSSVIARAHVRMVVYLIERAAAEPHPPRTS